MPPEISEIFPLIGQLLLAAAGGAGLFKLIERLIERFWPSSDTRLRNDADLRQELWERLEKFEMRIDAVNTELDQWKVKFFELLEKYHALKAENHAIREENHRLLSQLTAVQLAMQRLERQVSKIDPLESPAGPTADMPGTGHSILEEGT